METLQKQRKTINIKLRQKGLLNLEEISEGDILNKDGKKELIVYVRPTDKDYLNKIDFFKGQVDTITRNENQAVEELTYTIFGINKYFAISDLLQVDVKVVHPKNVGFKYDKLNKKLEEAGIPEEL